MVQTPTIAGLEQRLHRSHSNLIITRRSLELFYWLKGLQNIGTLYPCSESIVKDLRDDTLPRTTPFFPYLTLTNAARTFCSFHHDSLPREPGREVILRRLQALMALDSSQTWYSDVPFKVHRHDLELHSDRAADLYALQRSLKT